MFQKYQKIEKKTIFPKNRKFRKGANKFSKKLKFSKNELTSLSKN